MPPMRQESVKKVVLQREFVLLVEPGFIQEKRIQPDNQKEHQKLTLKGSQIQ